MPLPSLRSTVILATTIIAAFAGVYLYASYRSGAGARWGTYDWHCTSCGHNFRAAIPDNGSGQFIRDCPSCGKPTAERIVHLKCRACGAAFDLHGMEIHTAAPHCPKCQSTNVIAAP